MEEIPPTRDFYLHNILTLEELYGFRALLENSLVDVMRWYVFFGFQVFYKFPLAAKIQNFSLGQNVETLAFLIWKIPQPTS